MSIKALNKNLHVPVAVHAKTAGPITVLHLLNSSPSYTRPDDLPEEGRAAFVISAWRKGLWSGDVIIDQSQPLTMEDAIAEVEANSEHGQLLVKTSLRALEMLRDRIEGIKGEQE